MIRPPTDAPPPPPDPAAWRERFLLDPTLVPLNHGSFGACPAEVLEAQQALQREAERDLTGFFGTEAGSRLEAARVRLAQALDADPDALAFVPNATTGVQVAADSIRLGPGDEVLTTDLEYGACLGLWARRCEETGATLRIAEVPLPLTEAGFTAALLAALSPRTRVLFASLVTSATALVLPLQAVLARVRAAGVVTVVDAAHAPGMALDGTLPALSLRQLDADFCTGNLHKWVCAPKGAAFLQVAPARHAGVRAPVSSWGQLAAAAAAGPQAQPPLPLDSLTGTTALQRALQWQGTRDLSAFLTVPAVLDWWRALDPPTAPGRPADAPGPARAAARGRVLDLLARHTACWGETPLAAPGLLGTMAALPLPPALAPGGTWTASAAQALQQRLRTHHRIVVPVTQHRGRTFIRVSGAVYVADGDLQALEAAWPVACEAMRAHPSPHRG